MTSAVLRLALLAVAVGAGCGRDAAPEASQPANTAELAIPRHEPRPGREMPVVAVLAYNPATEVTDFVVPYAVLAEAGVAEVVAVATQRGPIEMRPALRFQAETTLAEFDRRFPGGADYVVVPNVYDGEDDAPLLEWIRDQQLRGATIVGVCDGVPTLAKAGVLDGRSATTHWNTIDRMERDHPETRWMRNRRYLADGNVITTSGVSASIPIAMALVEAIGGRERALEVGKRLGVRTWGPEHDSERFRLTAGSLATALANKTMFWRHEDVGIEVGPGVDEIRVALVADAYGRTRRTRALTIAWTAGPVRTRRGLVLLPDHVSATPPESIRMLSLMERLPPVETLDRSLQEIERRYGRPTAEFVALTMEYAWAP